MLPFNLPPCEMNIKSVAERKMGKPLPGKRQLSPAFRRSRNSCSLCLPISAPPACPSPCRKVSIEIAISIYKATNVAHMQPRMCARSGARWAAVHLFVRCAAHEMWAKNEKMKHGLFNGYRLVLLCNGKTSSGARKKAEQIQNGLWFIFRIANTFRLISRAQFAMQIDFNRKRFHLHQSIYLITSLFFGARFYCCFSFVHCSASVAHTPMTREPCWQCIRLGELPNSKYYLKLSCDSTRRVMSLLEYANGKWTAL